jgi:hypothetical protein
MEIESGNQGEDLQGSVERKVAHNVRRAEIERGVVPLSQRVPFVCECRSADCLHALFMTVGEYDACHQRESWAVVRPGHCVSAEDHILLHRNRYWVVEHDGTHPSSRVSAEATA